MLGIPGTLAVPFFSGLFEITLGATLISEITTDSLLPKVILVSFILGFNGFSVQAQVASILAKTDIRFSPYVFARVLHGIIASILTIIFYKPLYLDYQTMYSEITVATQPTDTFFSYTLQQLTNIGPFITILFLWVGFLLFIKNSKNES